MTSNIWICGLGNKIVASSVLNHTDWLCDCVGSELQGLESLVYSAAVYKGGEHSSGSEAWSLLRRDALGLHAACMPGLGRCVRSIAHAHVGAVSVQLSVGCAGSSGSEVSAGDQVCEYGL